MIACAWWGALYGFEGVPEINYSKLEFKDKLIQIANQLLDIHHV